MQLRAATYAEGQRMLQPGCQDPVQRQSAGSARDVPAAAAEGVGGAGGALPHLDAIQAAFGHHDVSGVRAHSGPRASAAAEAIGAEAYAMGGNVAFGRAPSLHTAAHEAAHFVQQRAGVQLSGGVGRAGDCYEQHADAVADLVVQGQSAAGLLDRYAQPSSGASGRDVQCRHVDVTHFGVGLANLTCDHMDQITDLRQDLIEQADGVGYSTDWDRYIERIVGYASPEGTPDDNLSLSEDRSRAVAEYLFLGERGVDPEGYVEGVGEDHEGHGCLEEERPLWRKVRVHLQEAELPERTSVEEPDQPERELAGGIDYDNALWWIEFNAVRREAEARQISVEGPDQVQAQAWLDEGAAEWMVYDWTLRDNREGHRRLNHNYQRHNVIERLEELLAEDLIPGTDILVPAYYTDEQREWVMGPHDVAPGRPDVAEFPDGRVVWYMPGERPQSFVYDDHSIAWYAADPNIRGNMPEILYDIAQAWNRDMRELVYEHGASPGQAQAVLDALQKRHHYAIFFRVRSGEAMDGALEMIPGTDADAILRESDYNPEQERE